MSLRGSEAAEAIYYHGDHLGSSNVITDETGAQVARYEYSPYGSLAVQEPLTDNRSPNYLFTGKELDSTGLYFYGARYYDPEIGRFVSADTIIQAPYDPQSLNRYAYCRNNPLKYTDPSGHFFFLAAIIGAIIGAISSAATGGNIGLGILTGALGGILFAGAGSIVAGMGLHGMAAAGVYAGAGAISGAASAGITGGNIGIGALTGAIGGALGYGASLIGGPFGLLAGVGSGAVAGGLGSVLLGGKFGEGAWRGAASAGISYAVSTAAQSLGSKPKTEAEKQDQQRESQQLQTRSDKGYVKGGVEGQMKAVAEVAGDSVSTDPSSILGTAGDIAEVAGAKQVSGALSVASNILNTDGTCSLVGGIAGGGLGFSCGGLWGAKIGFEIGMCFGPITAATGAMVGYYIGSVGGGAAGGWIGNILGRQLDSSDYGNAY